MKKIIGKYQLVACTAIAVSEGDTVRQGGVLIRDLDAAPGDADGILVGWSVSDLPDSEPELEDSISGEYASTYEEDLRTVEVRGLPLSRYACGAL